MTVMTLWLPYKHNVIDNVIQNYTQPPLDQYSVFINFRWAELIVTMTCEDT